MLTAWFAVDQGVWMLHIPDVGATETALTELTDLVIIHTVPPLQFCFLLKGVAWVVFKNEFWLRRVIPEFGR